MTAGLYSQPESTYAPSMLIDMEEGRPTEGEHTIGDLVDRAARRGIGAPAMSDSGHVWTAPWQEPSDVVAALVGCGHVSGLLMRQVWPLALMLCADRVPIERLHLEVR